MPTLTLTGINDGASSLLDAVNVEWHVCLGAAGEQTECQYGTGTITAGSLNISTTSTGYHEGTLKIVGSTETKPFAGTAVTSTADAPVIDSIDPLDTQALVHYTHAGFGDVGGYYQFFSSDVAMSEFESGDTADGLKTLGVVTPLTNGVTYDITMKAFFADGYVAPTSNMVQVTPAGSNAVPVFTVQPSNASISAGSFASFTAVASGTPSPTYQWQEDQGTGTWRDIETGSFSGETTTQLVIQTSDTSLNGWSYRNIATNSEGSDTSDSALLNVSVSSGTVTLWDDNFDSYSVGTSLTSYGYGAAAGSIVDNAVSSSAANSVRCNIISGATSFGTWGWIRNLSANDYIQNGDTVKVSLDCYWPSSFSFDSGTAKLKFLRMRRYNVSGVHQGYDEVQFQNNGTKMSFKCEGLNTPPSATSTPFNVSIARDTWINFRFEVTLGTQSADLGGTGRMKMYKDDVLIQDWTSFVTMGSATDRLQANYVWTYWNGGAPQTQSCYHDNYKIQVIRA